MHLQSVSSIPFCFSFALLSHPSTSFTILFYIRHLLLPQLFHTALLVFKHNNPSLSTSVFFITIKLSPFSRSLHFSSSFFLLHFLLSLHFLLCFFSFSLSLFSNISHPHLQEKVIFYRIFLFHIGKASSSMYMYLFLTCSANFNIVIYFTLLSFCAENVFQIEREEVFRGEGIGREGMAIQMERSPFK